MSSAFWCGFMRGFALSAGPCSAIMLFYCGLFAGRGDEIKSAEFLAMSVFYVAAHVMGLRGCKR